MRRMYSLEQLKNVVNEQIASGLVPSAKIFENIVDKDGHKRFIEGDITIEEKEGVTQTYGKWSLSGTHLLIVICFDVDNGTVMASGKFAEVNVPAWVVDKINPIFSTQVIRTTTNLFANDYTTQSLTTNLAKSSNKIEVQTGNLTLSANRSGRIQLDLLIDDE